MFKYKSEIVNGKKRIIITREVSHEDKTKEAVLRVMGANYEYVSEKKAV